MFKNNMKPSWIHVCIFMMFDDIVAVNFARNRKTCLNRHNILLRLHVDGNRFYELDWNVTAVNIFLKLNNPGSKAVTIKA